MMSFGTLGRYFSVHVNELQSVDWIFGLPGEVPDLTIFAVAFLPTEPTSSTERDRMHQDTL